MGASDNLSRSLVQTLCDHRFERGRPPNHGTKATHSGKVVDDLVARRRCALSKGHLLFWVNDWYYANLARIGYIELTACKPLIEEPRPSCERSRRRCTHKFGDGVWLDSVEEGSQNAEIYAFPLQCEDEMSF